MICKNCGEEYDQEMFPVCPFCLTANEQYIKSNVDESISIEQDTKVILDIPVLSMKSKKVYRSNCITNFVQFRENIKENELSSIKDPEAKSKAEILRVVNNGDLQRNSDEQRGTEKEKVKIADVFAVNKYNLFVSYCNDNELIYIDDLNGFDFGKLGRIQGIGVGKISDIIRQYENISSISKMEIYNNFLSPKSSEEPDVEKKMFGYINEQFLDLSIDMLIGFGIKDKMLELLSNRGIYTIGQLQNISVNSLIQMVGSKNIEKFKAIEDYLKKNLVDVFADILSRMSSKDDFQLTLKKSEGYTLQEIGEEKGVTRERVRQIISKFNFKITPFMKPMIQFFMGPREYITAQKILDIYDNDDFDKVLIYWCKSYEMLEYLDFADVFVLAQDDKKLVEDEILGIAVDFIGDGINLYENMEEFESLMQDSGYPYVDCGTLMNLVQKHGYKFYGDYVVHGKQSYGYLCSKVVAKKFPNGIKLYGGNDLELLRRYVLEEYGDIGVPDNDRAFSARLCSYLILSGRGEYTSSENIQVELNMVEQIKDYVDESLEGEIYYSELFSKYEGIIRMMSNVDNYNFLHGVLMMYYPDDYDYTRDFLKKKGAGYTSGKLNDKIKNFICEQQRPVHKSEIRKKVDGLTDIVLINAVNADKELVQWDYNYYTTTSLLELGDDIREYLVRKIEQIMDKNNGYCSDNLLIDEVKKEQRQFVIQNHIKTANNLYFLCAKIFSNLFDFRRPHIGKKGLLGNISVKNVALHLLEYPVELSFEKYVEIAHKLRWSDVTTGVVFTDIEQEYVRVSKDLYIKKDNFSISEEIIASIEMKLIKNMKYDMIALIGFDMWNNLPEIKYEWNPYLLHAIVEKYSKQLKVIETRVKNRRYEKGIIVSSESEFTEYVDIVIHFLKSTNRTIISEGDMLTLLILNGLTYKMIPKELYTSEKIIYKNEQFII